MSQYAPDLFKVKMNDGSDHKPDKDLGLWVLLVTCIIAIVLVIGGFTSCNPTKRAYKAIEKHEPKTTADTSRLLKRAKTILKTPAPVVKPGKTIVRTVKIPEKVKVLDTALLKRLADSVSAQYQKDGIEIAKDCEQSVKEALQKGIKQGYAIKIAEASQMTFIDNDPDTVFVQSDSLQAENNLLKIATQTAQNDAIKSKAQKDTYRGLFWVVLALLIVSGAINVKKLLSPKNVIS